MDLIQKHPLEMFKILTHSGKFVDERLLNRGIYTTSIPTLRNELDTKDDIIEALKKYNAIMPEKLWLENSIENLEKCELKTFKLVET